MADFHDVLFPTSISYGSVGGPEFSTEVIEYGGGHEQRNSNWEFPRERWNVAYGVNTQEKLDVVRQFFYARKGRLHGFRFRNPDDFEAVGEELLPTDDPDVFQLAKVYGDGDGSTSRKITRPVDGTVIVSVNGSPESVSVDYDTGLVTFGSGPSSSDSVTADFEFDIPARFDTDYLPVTLETLNARSAGIEIVEIRE